MAHSDENRPCWFDSEATLGIFNRSLRFLNTPQRETETYYLSIGDFVVQINRGILILGSGRQFVIYDS